MASTAPVFLYEALAPLGEEEETWDSAAPADSNGEGISGLGLHETEVSVSEKMEVNSRSIESAETVEDAGYLSLNLMEDNVETMVEGRLRVMGKKMVTVESLNISRREAPPWAQSRSGHKTWFRSPLLQLHQEIVDFCEFVAPTEEEQQQRKAAVERVSAVVKLIWPSCQVCVFGSFATGLYLPTSDVDVVILDSGCQVRQDGLKALAKALTRNAVAKNIQVIGKARVPIVKFVERSSNIAFDISFDVANGPEAADFIKGAMQALPPLRPLCLVLKIFLQQRELNEVYQGGIGSYALLVMLLAHLQVLNLTSSLPLESNLGILLVDFFDLYGRSLNMKDVGVSCRIGGSFFSKKNRGFIDMKRPFSLCVEDPQAPENDIGKNSFAIQKVRSAFVLAHSLLTDLSGDDTQEHIGLLGRIVRMDEKLVGRKLLPALVTTASENLQRPYQAPYTRFRNTQESAQDPDLEPYVVGDGTFSASDSDSDPAFKTPQTAGWRSRWHDYEDGDFPRGTSSGRKVWKKGKEKARHKDRNSTPYLSPYGQDSLKKHSRSRWQESESPAADEDSCTKHSRRRKRDRKNSEVTGLEEGEVRPGKRAKKLQERLSQNRENLQEAREDSRMKWKQKQASEDGDQTTKVKRHNLHKSWSGSEIREMTSDRNHSRFRRTPSRKEHWRHDAFEDL
ncbi:unnamed protein product [Sphagnum troendelagicum]|uniref:Uncharacterized protein n=1 Tax=Sphagnum troendelagicum TaxID=128251 RepID=A0ABP0U1Q2_9BRYO